MNLPCEILPCSKVLDFISQGGESLLKGGYFLGEKTNNQAEYLALVLALFLLQKKIGRMEMEQVRITVFADSELLIRQMSGVYKVKNESIRKYKAAIDSILDGLKYSFKHVMRENNSHADELANIGIENKKKVPASFVYFLAKYDIIL